jgi:Fe-S-cluster containining protein
MPETSADYDISIIKHDYREIFTRAAAQLHTELDRLGAIYECAECDAAGREKNIEQAFHKGCTYRGWQQQAIAYLEQDVARTVLEKLNMIQVYKKQISCHMCGVCCRFASSEFSYPELLAKAEAGDSFATQFTGIFLPYASKEEARNRFPEIVDSVLSQADVPESVYFYHCPYIGEDNRCTVYGTPKRPAICESYPDTPLTFIYKNCAWKPWKDETHPDALWAHGMIEIVSWWIGRLKSWLEA